MLRISACSYEGSLFGWDLVPSTDSTGAPFSAQLHFGFNVTVNSSLRAVAVSKSGKYLATGGMNERISLFNVLENRAIGEISGHTGGITALQFFEDSMLLSASEDGTLFIWRVHDWEHLHILGGHKSTVLDFAIHPTGKLALSVSKDKTLRLWNLIQGKCAFTRSLRIPAELVQWHPAGSEYLLCTTKELQIFKTSDNSLSASYSSTARINHADFVCIDHSAGSYAVACIDDSQCLALVSLSTGSRLASVDLSNTSTGRLRSLTVTTTSLLEHKFDALTVITSTGSMICVDVSKIALSDGTTAVLPGDALLAVNEIKAEPRLTAVTSWVAKDAGKVAVSEEEAEEVAAPSKKRKRRTASAAEDEDEGKKKVSFVAPAEKKSKKDKKRKENRKEQKKNKGK